MAELIDQMLEFNPYLRPNARKLLENSIFDDIRKPNDIQSCSQAIEIRSDLFVVNKNHDDD
jgi:hypothetical protein